MTLKSQSHGIVSVHHDSTVRLIVVVQDESTGAVSSVHPSQTIATGAVSQTFNDEITLLMGHSDLAHRNGLEEPPANLPKLRWFQHTN